jgi:hypothetical protein
LVTTAFYGGVRVRFGREASMVTRADIIRFAARSRVRYGGDEAGFGPGLAEELMGAAVGLNPVPASPPEPENSDAQVALLTDLAAELTFLDFEKLLEPARVQVSKLDPPPGTGEGGAGRDPAPALAAGPQDPADVLAAVERVKAQGDATASRVSALEAQVRDLQAQLESSLATGR